MYRRTRIIAAVFGALFFIAAVPPGRAQTLLIGHDPGSNESLTVGSGSYSYANMGYEGIGTLINNGASIGMINLGYEGSGTYIQNGSTASVITTGPTDEIEVGFFGSGNIIQNAGTIST